MQIKFSWKEQLYRADLSAPLDLAIRLQNGIENQPNAYGAPAFSATPVVAGDFIGALDAGAPVNFFNLAINPHGNGTHTECVGHILQGPYMIGECLRKSHFVAELISVTPRESPQGACVHADQLQSAIRHEAEALIVRTLPNTEAKMTQQYTGTNPPWFHPEAMEWIAGIPYHHLLTDLPSVDPETDGGALLAHKAFWRVGHQVRDDATITEMIYAPSNIPDGLYLLNLQNLALDLDVSPSRPLLFVMEKE